MVIETCLVVCEMKYLTDVTSLSFIHRIQHQQQHTCEFWGLTVITIKNCVRMKRDVL